MLTIGPCNPSRFNLRFCAKTCTDERESRESSRPPRRHPPLPESLSLTSVQDMQSLGTDNDASTPGIGTPFKEALCHSYPQFLPAYATNSLQSSPEPQVPSTPQLARDFYSNKGHCLSPRLPGE